jgi:hypothetical protein
MEIIKKKRAPRKKPELSIVTGEEPKTDLPDFNAVGMVRMKNGDFCSVAMEIRDGKMRVVDVGEGNTYGIALHDMKIQLQKRVLDAFSF